MPKALGLFVYGLVGTRTLSALSSKWFLKHPIEGTTFSLRSEDNQVRGRCTAFCREQSEDGRPVSNPLSE